MSSPMFPSSLKENYMLKGYVEEDRMKGPGGGNSIGRALLSVCLSVIHALSWLIWLI